MITENIQKLLQHLQDSYAGLQIGRATPALLDAIQVENYGAKMPLKSVANISCPDPRTIRIEPWDKSQIGEIEKSIYEADIGINPQNMDSHLFLPIPPMTEERRIEMAKRVKELAEEARVSLRNARHEAMKHIRNKKDAEEISEDQQKNEEEEIQKLIDKANEDIGTMAKNKENDVMTV